MGFPVKITGTVYFSTYLYPQIARIYVTVPDSTVETDTGITVIPIGTTNVGLFEYWANAAGIYTFRAEARNATTGVVGGSSIFQKTVPPQPQPDLEALMTARNALGIAQQARAEMAESSSSGIDDVARGLAQTAIGIAQEARASSGTTLSGVDILEVQVFS